MRRNVVISVLFVCFGGPAIALLYVPLWLTHFRVPLDVPKWQIALAASLIAVGLIPALESTKRFIFTGGGTLLPPVPTKRLVVSGFYCYVRNPMYLGVLMTLAGEALLFHSRTLAEFACWLWLGFHLFVVLYEERTLKRRFGEQYVLYRQNVPRWIPHRTAWRQPVAREV